MAQRSNSDPSLSQKHSSVSESVGPAGGDIPPTVRKQGKRRVESPCGDIVDGGFAAPEEPRKYNIRRGKEGVFVIFNHEVFEVDDLRSRKGTGADVKGLTEVWENLGFRVYDHHDLTYEEISMKIKKYSEGQYHRGNDCFGLAVLTHGGEKDMLYAKNASYHVRELLEPFRDCESLFGKPKLFFIQACRGQNLDDGNRVEGDTVDAKASAFERQNQSCEDEVTIPRESDFLIAYSTVEGYYSWRDQTEGSWFIKSLNRCMLNLTPKWDLLTILTQVCREVSRKESSTNVKGYAGKKQCSSIVSRLTGQIYFTPRNVTKSDTTEHLSTRSMAPRYQSLQSESSVFERETDQLTSEECCQIEMELLKKKKEVIELKQKLCRARLQRIKFEV